MSYTGALCPDCQGCGRTSLDQFGRIVPQPTWVDSNSSAPGWTKCAKCQGSGVIVMQPDCFGRNPSKYLNAGVATPDIVERLRNDARGWFAYNELSDEAADEIERMREALQEIGDETNEALVGMLVRRALNIHKQETRDA
jgi:hypothetical protein